MKLVLCCLLALLPNLSKAQGLDPSKLLQKEPTDTWPTYNGDYSGRRFSPLTEIQISNVKHLSLAWMYRVKIAGGAMRGVGDPDIKSTPLMVNGVLYFTIPDHVYALDARTGAELWHYDWVDKGGHLIGNRGVGMYRNWLYFMAPDGWFISLEAATGKERWRKKVADEKMQYFTTGAPMVVGNHVIMGVGGDAIDVPGYLESRDPETGELQWRWNSEPAKGEPGSETWPNESAMSHGGGMTWLPGTYDSQLNLVYWGTGNANPVMAGQGRPGANLWTCSIVALNADTGKLAWYFQGSPHDTHDWDNTETPVLFDADVDGKPRKLLAQAARNGYFFVLDRTNGAHVISKPFVGLNWSKGIDDKGQPIPDPQREPTVDGNLLTINGGGGTNWMPPSYSPQTGLFYVNATRGYSVTYLTDTSANPEGYGGSSRNLWSQHVLEALDYKTGEIKWSHPYTTTDPSGGGYVGAGILTTAGGLLFTGDYNKNLIAFNAANGEILWHFPMLHSMGNGAETYLLDGHQYLIAAGGDTLYAFTLNE
ncbi:MAG TPA: acido-empty-quinoprotein group A [Acidobacteriaceae bacterium]|nr:acido-empty-quinoprotein group A [Acidobacteriaceae bacterium]